MQLRGRLRRLLVALAVRLPGPVLEQPWGVFILVACVLSGASYFTGSEPGTLARLLPHAVVVLWYVDLVFGGAVGLAGLVFGRWRLEVAGMLPLGTSALVYAFAIFQTFGGRGVVAASLIAAFGLAAFIRALAVYTALAVARSRLNGVG